VDRQRELVTLERLERRRGETWPGLWLAPLLTLVAQAFLLGVLADENVGWLARAAVLVAAVAGCLAAIWSVLRAHAREVQYAEAIAAISSGASDGRHPDLRPSALPRPHRRRRAPAPADAAPAEHAEPVPAPEAETTVTENVADEGETAVLDATPPPAKKVPLASAPTPAPEMPTPSPGRNAEDEPKGWVARWDRHLVWWAAGDSHAKAYMAWTATLALFLLADVAVYLSAV
jgi:hypothetical protein